MQDQDHVNKLILIQEKDLGIKELLALQKELPQLLSGEKGDLTRIEKELQDLKEESKVLHVDRKKLELDVDVAVERRRKYEVQLMGVKTNQEYKSLEKEIYSLKVDTQKIENEILRLMEEIEEEEVAIKEKEVCYQESVEKIKVREREVQDKLKKCEEDLNEVHREREQLVAGVDLTLLKRYEKIIARVKGKAIVPIIDRNCKGCFTLLPPQVVINVRRGNGLTTCDNCGRILIYSEPSPTSSE